MKDSCFNLEIHSIFFSSKHYICMVDTYQTRLYEVFGKEKKMDAVKYCYSINTEKSYLTILLPAIEQHFMKQ